MHECLFAAQCTEHICDSSCPIYTELSYLLERNNIDYNNPVLKADKKDLEKIQEVLKELEESSEKLKVITTNEPTGLKDLLLYVLICQNWKGNRMHCNVYNVNYSNYLQEVQKSWNLSTTPAELEYEDIWIKTAKNLVITNLNYITFKDFSAQTLMQMIDNRAAKRLNTIVIAPPINQLVGTGMFFEQMVSKLKAEVVQWH